MSVLINIIFITIACFMSFGTCWCCYNDCQNNYIDDDNYNEFPIDSLGVISDPYH